MKARNIVLTVALCLLMAGSVSTVRAQEEVESGLIQLSLFPPIQIYDTHTPIEGFRLGLFSMNSDMTGLDLGLLTWTTEDLAAVQFGIVNIVEEKAAGIEFGTLNIVGRKMVGWQAAFLNITGNGFVGFQNGTVNVVGGEKMVGFQLAAVNYASEVTGLQIGFVNITPKLNGLQIGIVNFAANSALPVMVIANAHF